MAEPRFLVGLTMAARLTGKQRSTILRAIQSGRLSERRDGHNRRRVDVAELERVYGTLRTVADTSAAPRASEAASVAPGASGGASHAELERLKTDLERERERADRERERADRQERKAEEWQDAYRKLAERVLLTDQRTGLHNSEKTAENTTGEAPPKARRQRRQEPQRPRTATEELAAVVSNWLTGGR